MLSTAIFRRTRLLLTGVLCLPVFAAAQPSADVHLASVHALIGNLATGEILYRKNEDVAVAIASVTKLMTAMVVVDSGQPLDEWITVMDWDRGSREERLLAAESRFGGQARRASADCADVFRKPCVQ